MTRKNIYITTGVIALLALASCKKDLTKTNTNPTSVSATTYNANFLLTTIQLMLTGSSDFGSDNWGTEWGELGGFVQHTASTNLSWYSGDKYMLNLGNSGIYFTQSYMRQVQPAVELYQLTLNNDKFKNLHQISRIMKAMVFERITDIYGDVPYTQAGQGYYTNNYTPEFDKQQDIYTDLLKEVSEATDSLDESADLPTGDVYYYRDGSNDQIAQWRRFGNSLLLRMAMRLTKVDPETAKSYVTKVIGQTFTSNDDNAVFQHQLGTLTQNRDSWSILEQDSSDLKLCKTYIDSLKLNDDPRLSVMAEIFATGSTDPADQMGLPPGLIFGGSNPAIDVTQVDATNYNSTGLGMQGYSRFNDNILSYTAPNLVLTYAETEFLLADAYLRWGIGTSAEDHYNNGLAAAITQLSVYGDASTIDPAVAQTYVDNHPYLGDATGLSQINTQYWLCTVMDEYEAWANYRRTGFPALTPTNYPGNSSGGTIPRRLIYPTSEKVTNQTNYNTAVSRLTSGDSFISRMWWDTAN